MKRKLHRLPAVIILPALFLSCATADMEKAVRLPAEGRARKGDGAPSVIAVPVEGLPPEIIEIERPVYMPHNAAPSAAAPAKGKAAVEESNRKGISRPSEYSGAAMVYDFNPDWVYEVYGQPLRVSDICLEPGETASEEPFISDSERWILGAGVSRENGAAVQHIYVKPVEASLAASLIINTNRRVYHIVLRSYTDAHMPIVRWRYPSSGMPNSYVSAPAGVTGAPGADGEIAGADPRFLSFNYRVTYPLFRKPSWMPKMVYDDGKRTYVMFPEGVLMAELPAVFENRDDIVNYRVAGNVVIIDRLVETLTVKKEGRSILIEKKRG
jgi:type IV secretion system protein VirB9